MENNKPMTASAQQQPQVEPHPCDCGHNVPNEFVHSNDDGVTMCSRCMMEYKNDKIQQLQEKLHDMDVLAEMNAEACERATKIFRKDHPDFIERNALPDNTTAINYVCDLLEKQQPQVSKLPSEVLIPLTDAVAFAQWRGSEHGLDTDSMTLVEEYNAFLQSQSKQKGETNE